MLSITYAFVVATGLLCLFERSRGLAAIGVFVLLCIHPLLFSALLLLAGATYYIFYYRRKYHEFPKLPFRRR